MRNGELLMERYYPMIMNEPEDNGWKTRLPNVVLHHFPNNVRDEYSHDHGRACMAIILRGGYRELRDGKVLERNAPCIWTLGYDSFHQIVRIKPDTWTLFFVGWKRREYRMKLPKTGRIVLRSSLRTPSSVKGVIGAQRETPELQARLALRRKQFTK